MSPSDDRIEFGWEHRGEADGAVSYGHDDQVEFGPGGYDGDEPPPTRLDALLRSRVAAAALAVATVVGVGVAVVGRLPVADRPAASPPPGSSGLTTDQSACFGFALVNRRAELLVGSRLPHGVGPRARAIGDEVKALDRLAARNPSADYRLVSAFADVADQAVRMLGVRGRRAAAAIAVDWVAAARAAGDACVELAGFDIDAVRPVAPGDGG
jgi:hypothetical protein